jgi:hypothetical protein
VAFWIKLTYERNIYVVDLDRVAAFCQRANGRISFTLPAGQENITITQQADPATYQTLVDYVQKVSGFDLKDEE